MGEALFIGHTYIDVTVLEDGCAAPTPALHKVAIEGLRPVADIAIIAEVLKSIG